MKRRDFHKTLPFMGIGALAGGLSAEESSEFYKEAAKKLPIRKFDVVVAGGGTAGVMAAVAAARQGANTALVEWKGYVGGAPTEGGTALHSFYNLWKAFPGVSKRQVIKGIPQELVDRLIKIGATSGHAEMEKGYDYDSVCTAIDVEMFKLTAFELLQEAGVFIAVNSMVVGAVRDGNRVKGALVESRSGRELFTAQSFIDCTAYGDLAGRAGAEFTEPNDHPVCNSVGLANVDIEQYHKFLVSHNALKELAKGKRSGDDNKIVRLNGYGKKLPPEFAEKARKIGMSLTMTTTYDNYFMFIKVNYKMPVSPTNRDEASLAEIEIRKRQAKAVELFRKFVPGCEKAFIARTAPNFNIRRGRCISCDYDMTHEDVIDGRHFDDEVYNYGFHDSAPRLQIKNGGTWGLPYRALLAQGISNLYVAGMMITSDRRAHMSTRNTVSCMAMGQASGTAAALCAQQNIESRELKYAALRQELEKANVYFEV